MYFSLGEGFGNQGDHRKIRESCLLQSGNLSAVLRILKEEPARPFSQQSLSISIHVQHCLSSEGEFIRSTKSTEGRAGEKFQEGFSTTLWFSDSSTSILLSCLWFDRIYQDVSRYIEIFQDILELPELSMQDTIDDRIEHWVCIAQPKCERGQPTCRWRIDTDSFSLGGVFKIYYNIIDLKGK